jgi:hypothetical protein
MAQGDLPAPRGGGPFRRRREKRQLEQLAQASKQHVALTPSTAHVRVVEDQAEVVAEGQADGAEGDRNTSEPGPPNDGDLRGVTTGFHVRPVPIDQPIGE